MAARRLKCSAVSSCSCRSAMTSLSAAAEASVVGAPFAAAAATWVPVEATKLPQLSLSRARTCGRSCAMTGSSHSILLKRRCH